MGEPTETTRQPPILVWRFCDAPAYLQELSANGGDEDWLAWVPSHIADDYIPWLDHGSFGVCEIDRLPQLDGSIVFIGSHS